MTEYHTREISGFLDRVLRQFPIVVISGARQTGKSTLVRQEPALAHNRCYHALDHLGVLEQARDHADAFLSSSPALTLDEAQRLPELSVALKRAVDANRVPGRFVLTGSANLLLMERVTDSLAGRAFFATLHPMNRREIHRCVDNTPMLAHFMNTGEWLAPSLPPITEEEILRGGYPEMALDPGADRWVWFQGYEQTYLDRDVRSLQQVEDLIGFRRLLGLAALRMGSVLNAAELGRDAQLPRTTVVRHLDLLEAMFLIRRLQPFLGNRASRLIKSPKLYFCDSGLAAHLAGVSQMGPSSIEPLRGALVENFVLQNLLAILEPHLAGVQLYYWHEQGRREVDFVVEHRQAVVAIEVKSTSQWRAADLDGLRTFLDRTPRCRAGLLSYLGTELVSLGERLWAVPIHLLLA